MNRNLPALSDALDDWRDLATDRDAADALLHIAERRERYARLQGHLQTLREEPPQFDATDLERVLAEISSAQSLRQQIIEGNELEVLVPTLRAFLFEQDERIEEKLAIYPPLIRYAGHTILAELWGWAHLDAWPIYHPAAVRGLRRLGWEVPERDYLAFASAFEDLRTFYNEGARVAPQLPLNLELDLLLTWANDTLKPSATSRASSYSPPTRRAYAIREFGAPYDTASAPPFAWPDGPLAVPNAERRAEAEHAIRRQLALPPTLIGQAAAHLLAGRHLVLTGAPGTGKSHLASLLAAELFGYYPMLVTATAEWSAFDVVGGLVPQASESGVLRYDVRPGVVYEALRHNWLLADDGSVRRDGEGRPLRVSATQGGQQWPGVWLVIDELNRADIDKAFGDLFTALESGALRVPQVGATPTQLVPLPQDFRIVATLNSRDRHFLFTMSDALKRRFAFLELSPPDDQSQERAILLDRAAARLQAQQLDVPTALLDRALTELMEGARLIRAFHPLGTAPLLATLTYVGAAHQLGDVAASESLQQSVIADLLPQLESLHTLPLQLLALLFSGARDAALAALQAAIEQRYADEESLAALHALATLLSSELAEQSAALQRQPAQPRRLDDALELWQAVNEQRQALPAPRWPHVAATLGRWNG
ncbi:MAG: AAA family ATPase [Anaerolineales bacterium]|nr:AAA family ATPase [Anaerolineales bacterium]MCB9127836.1 AAA family ATPase [Ardenticatenales bacterium]